MATGSSVFLIALGAILAFAVDAEVAGLDLTAVGVILMIAGAIGIVVSLMYADRFRSMGSSHTVVEDREVVGGTPVGTGRVVESRRTTRERL